MTAAHTENINRTWITVATSKGAVDFDVQMIRISDGISVVHKAQIVEAYTRQDDVITNLSEYLPHRDIQHVQATIAFMAGADAVQF